MKTFIIKEGFVYDRKIIPWDVFFDVLSRSGMEKKSIERVQKQFFQIATYNEITLIQNITTKEVAELLGIKVIDNSKLLLKNVKKRLNKLREDNVPSSTL